MRVTTEMPRYAAKVDAQHAAIRDVLRQFGWLVKDTSRLGGWVDLVAWRNGRAAFIEVKTAQSKKGTVRLTDSQEDMIAAGWPVVVLRNVNEAIEWAQRG